MATGGEAELFEGLPELVSPERGGGRGAARLRMAERRQVELRAISLEDLVPADHRVRLVWRFVEGLDLSGFQAAIKAVEGQPGHPPADPRILVALWLFATIEGIGSARAVARLCDEHIAYQWLCGGVGMNAKTLADFRVGTLLERLLVDSFTALVRAGAWTGSPRTASGCAHRPEPPRSAEARPWRVAGARPSRRCETCAPRSMAIRARSAGGKPVSAPPKSASAGRRWP
jgi:transposase